MSREDKPHGAPDRRAPDARAREECHRAALASSREPWAEALLSALTRPLLGRLGAVEVDHASVLELSRLAERGPIVFLPAHRTYLDTLVLAKMLCAAGLDRPWRLAGANLAFWPLGLLGRRSGMIFIRREFGTDPTYHAAVRARLAELLGARQGIEWYPEAGRSRTGRIRKLRTGMLRILVGAYADSGIEDVHVVPVSVVYDALPDMEALTALDAGAVKQPEGLRLLVHYMWSGRALGPRHAWMACGEPVSLRAVRQGSAGEWDAARTLAKRIAAGLRNATQVTAQSLLALVFATGTHEPVAADEVARQTALLAEYAAARGIPLCRTASVDSALDGLVRTRVFHRVGGGYAVNRGRERILAYHRNVAEHWFLPGAAAELVAVGAVTVQRISTLLAQPDGFAQRVRAELDAGDDGVRPPFPLAPRLLGPVFSAYHDVVVGSASPASRVELREAALALLAAEGLSGPDADAAARDAFTRELAGLAARLRTGTADVRR